MPIYDFECRKCGHIQEVFTSMSNCNRSVVCIQCGGRSKHIITMSGVHLGNEDAQGWVKSVLEVVDKDNKAPHVQNFIKDPTRKNYKAWMKGEGLRPLEPGERTKPKPRDYSKFGEKLFRRHQQRNRIEI